MQFQPKLPQPFPEVLQKTVGFRLDLESQDRVVGVAHDNHCPPCVLGAPRLHPEVEGVVEIDISQQGRDDGLNAKDNFEFDRAVRYRQERKKT